MTVETLLQEMSVREKIEQTVVVLMKKGKKIDFCPGAAFFFGQIITEAEEAGLAELRGYVSELSEKCKIPLMITSDFENGCGSMVKGLTPFPYMMGLGAANDPKLAYDYGKATALEARSVGANWTFSPVSDLNLNRRNPLVNNRALTDDTELACKLLSQVVKGMQEHGLSACAKHFPGDGVDYRDQHITATENTLPMDKWYETYGKVYRELIEAGVDSVMAGHITLPDYPQELSERFGRALPATLSKGLITDLLKGELGFQGIVVTDALDMGGFHGWFDTHEQAEIESFKAGCDMMLWPSENYIENMENAIHSGEISLERLDDAVRRILTVKYKSGLFDSSFELFRELTEEDHSFVKSVQKRCSEQSITLIRDKAGHFPLSPDKTKRLGIVVVAEHQPARLEAAVLKEEFEQRGFTVEYFDGDCFSDDARKEFYERNDRILYALFSRPFRPIGFLDYSRLWAHQVRSSLMPDHALDKCIYVSFGSPYFGDQYVENAPTYVNAYSMLECSARAFVRAACGEMEFQGTSPVKLGKYKVSL